MDILQRGKHPQGTQEMLYFLVQGLYLTWKVNNHFIWLFVKLLKYLKTGYLLEVFVMPEPK